MPRSESLRFFPYCDIHSVNGPEWNIAGTEKFLFILFADIRGFTSLSEALLPYDVIHLLKRYFHRMNRIIEKHGGFIDNYMGDGLMALFEAKDPFSGAFNSVRAGLEMLGTSFLISEKVYNLLKDRLRTGITAKIPIRGKAGEHTLYEVVGMS